MSGLSCECKSTPWYFCCLLRSLFIPCFLPHLSEVKNVFSLDFGFSRIESNARVLWSSHSPLGIPLSFNSSIGMAYVRLLLRPTSTSWNSCRGWIKEGINPLSFLQLRQCCYPGEIMWNKSMCYLQIISIPASDTEQTQNDVWCGIDS